MVANALLIRYALLSTLEAKILGFYTIQELCKEDFQGIIINPNGYESSTL